MPGRLVVIEGTDGVGRSTQIALLREWLETEGYAVEETGFRRSELTGDGIDRAMRGHTLDHMTMSLFYATDFWDRMEKSIIPALKAGKIALADRYIYSIIARARVRGVPARWLDDVLEFALVPDQVFYLDIDVDTCCHGSWPAGSWTTGNRARTFCGESDRHASFVRYQDSLLEEFHSLGGQYGFETVDARRSIREVFETLQQRVMTTLDTMQR